MQVNFTMSQCCELCIECGGRGITYLTIVVNSGSNKKFIKYLSVYFT